MKAVINVFVPIAVDINNPKGMIGIMQIPCEFTKAEIKAVNKIMWSSRNMFPAEKSIVMEALNKLAAVEGAMTRWEREHG